MVKHHICGLSSCSKTRLLRFENEQPSQLIRLKLPERRLPPKGCCPTTDPVDLSFM